MQAQEERARCAAVAREETRCMVEERKQLEAEEEPSVSTMALVSSLQREASAAEEKDAQSPHGRAIPLSSRTKKCSHEARPSPESVRHKWGRERNFTSMRPPHADAGVPDVATARRRWAAMGVFFLSLAVCVVDHTTPAARRMCLCVCVCVLRAVANIETFSSKRIK